MFSPIIIIGAPRSGTNMLRDLLSKIPDFGTWPCDEINYIWRHGNVKHPSDRFPPSFATNSVKLYIQGHFQRLAYKKKVKNIVEKTCANSLRVGFVDKILPDAKYIFLVRDGIDAVASAMKRWVAKLDLLYILKKSRYVPPMDLPYYTSCYFTNRIYKLFSKENRLASWGPRIDNLPDYLLKCSLEEICAHQWKQCVNLAKQDFCTMKSDKYCRINYEQFVTHPEIEMKKIVEFLGVSLNQKQCRALVKNSVSSESVGKGYIELNKEQLMRISPIIQKTTFHDG